jgi:hypothetical protein
VISNGKPDMRAVDVVGRRTPTKMPMRMQCIDPGYLFSPTYHDRSDRSTGYFRQQTQIRKKFSNLGTLPGRLVLAGPVRKWPFHGCSPSQALLHSLCSMSSPLHVFRSGQLRRY